jgi:hypothetical protein
MAFHIYNANYSRGRDRRIEVGGQPWEKLVRHYLKNKPGMVVHTCNATYLGSRGRRIMVQG